MSTTTLARPVDQQTTVLTAGEQHELHLLESVIERGLKTFVQVGAALSQIRSDRLYRQTYDTFEDYCQSRWQFSRRRASELITAADVAIRVGEISPIQPRESHAAELEALPASEQPAAWQEAVATSNGRVTARHVKEVVKLKRGKTVPSRASYFVEAGALLGKLQRVLDGLDSKVPGGKLHKNAMAGCDDVFNALNDWKRAPG